MKGMQLPLVSNTATTGHKLQESTVDNIFVYDWNYTINWPYVVLSRVTTMHGLFGLGKRIQKWFQTFKQPVKYRELMAAMRQQLAQMFTNMEKAEKFGWKDADDYET